MKATSLQISTPQGPSGSVLSGAEDYTFRYHHDASPRAAVSLLMPVRPDEFMRSP